MLINFSDFMVINVISACTFTLYTIIGNLLTFWLLPSTPILFVIIASIGASAHCAIAILLCVLSNKIQIAPRTVTGGDIPIAIAVNASEHGQLQ